MTAFRGVARSMDANQYTDYVMKVVMTLHGIIKALPHSIEKESDQIIVHQLSSSIICKAKDIQKWSHLAPGDRLTHDTNLCG